MTYVDHGRRHLPGGSDPIPVLEAPTYAPNPQEEWFQVVSVSISGMTTTQLTWSRLSGPLLLNTAISATQPRIQTRGVYTVDITSVVLSNATTTNHYQLSANLVQSAYTASILAQDTHSDDLTDAIQATVSITGVMNVSDSILIKILNMDTVARDFSCPSVRVTKILEF